MNFYIFFKLIQILLEIDINIKRQRMGRGWVERIIISSGIFKTLVSGLEFICLARGFVKRKKFFAVFKQKKNPSKN